MTIIRGSSSHAVALALGMALLAAACGASAPSAAPSGSPAASASASGAADASGSAPLPSSTPWPGNVPDAIIGLGEVDTQIENAGMALSLAIGQKDIPGLVAAANGLVILIDKSGDLVTTAQGYAATRPFADADAAAFAQLRAGANDIVDGSRVGDGTKVNAGIATLSAGIGAYAVVRKGLSGLLEQALAQKKKYVK